MAEEKLLDERFKSEVMRLLNTLILKVDLHDRKFDAIDERFNAIDKRFDAHDKRFDTLENKLDMLSAQVTEIGLKVRKFINYENSLRIPIKKFRA